MASIVGHALGAVTIWEVGRRLPGDWVPKGAGWYALPVVLAVLPDLDVLAPMVLSRGGLGGHRGWSHSALVALMLAGCGVLVLRARSAQLRAWPAFGVLAACALVHPLLDYLMGCGPPVPFLWPFWGRGWLSPVQLIPTANYPLSPAGFLYILTMRQTWAGVGLELASLAPLWLAARAGAITALIALTVSAGGFTATLLLYN